MEWLFAGLETSVSLLHVLLSFCVLPDNSAVVAARYGVSFLPHQMRPASHLSRMSYGFVLSRYLRWHQGCLVTSNYCE